MPREGKEPFGLHLLHDGLPVDMLVSGMSNLTPRNLTPHEWAIELHRKPLAELTIVRQGAPDLRNRCLSSMRF